MVFAAGVAVLRVPDVSRVGEWAAGAGGRHAVPCVPSHATAVRESRDARHDVG